MYKLQFRSALILALVMVAWQSSFAQEDRKQDSLDYRKWSGRQLKPLKHNGKPFFAIGAYGIIRKNDGSNFMSLKELAENGWNVVLGGLDEDPQKAREKLDKFDKHGIGFMYDTSIRLFVLAKTPADKQKELDFLKAIKDHPAIVGYYIFDEPENGFWNDKQFKKIRNSHPKTSPHKLFPAYVKKRIGWMKPAIRKIDKNPEHYIFMCIAWWDKYNSLQFLCDVNMPNSYPTRHTKKEFQGDQVKYPYDASLAHEASVKFGRSMPFIFTPYACDILTGIESYRTPTYREFRYSAFSPITRGAMGCMFWAGYRCKQDYAERVIFPVTRELAGLQKFLVGKWHDKKIKVAWEGKQTPTLKKYGNTPRVTACVREAESGKYLIIVSNNVPLETKFKIKSRLLKKYTTVNLLLPPEAKQPVNSNDTVAGEVMPKTVTPKKVVSGVLNDSLGPYEIKLYLLDS